MTSHKAVILAGLLALTPAGRKLLAAAEQVRVDGSGNFDVLNGAIHDGPLAVCAVVALFVWRPVPGAQPEYATSMPTPMSRSTRTFCMHALSF